MKKVEEFIELLENQTISKEECDNFLQSLSKEEFIYFLKKDFTINERKKKFMFELFGSSINEDFAKNDSINKRLNLFAESPEIIHKLIQQFSKEEIKQLLPQIQLEYTQIKEMFIKYFVQQVHNNYENFDENKTVVFLEKLKEEEYSVNDIPIYLSQMTKPEFSFFLCLDKTFSNIKYFQKTIKEIISQYNDGEIVEIIPFINDVHADIKKELFKKLSANNAYNIFISNPYKYKNEIICYLVNLPSSPAKDQIITNILTQNSLYSFFDENEINILHSQIEDKEVILDENSNIINTYQKDIKEAAFNFIKNIRTNDKPNIKRGILKKLSAKSLHSILNEVNKSLVNSQIEPISYKEFIHSFSMPLSKTILFLNECSELTEVEKKQILNELFKENNYQNLSIKEIYNSIIGKSIDIVLQNNIHNDEELFYCYQDILELEYIPEFYNKMAEKFVGSVFYKVTPESINIFLSQIVEKFIKENNLNIKKDFYVGPTFSDTNSEQEVQSGGYNLLTKTIQINTNVLTEINKKEEEVESIYDPQVTSFVNKSLIFETTFHELRHAYQDKTLKTIGGIRDFYFMLDQLIHQHAPAGIYLYHTNYEYDIRELDAQLYAKIALASLLKYAPAWKKMFLEVKAEEIKSLAAQRRAPQLRKRFPFETDEERIDLLELFRQEMEPSKVEELAEEYPMLHLITEDGYLFHEEQLLEKYQDIEATLNTLSPETEEYEIAKKSYALIGMILNRIYNKNIEVKKGK